MVSFKDMQEKDEESLMIVDALNLAFRYKHSKSVNFVDDYIRTIQSLARSYKCAQVIITCDKGSSSYRKALYPEYKGNRKEKIEQQTEADKLEFEAFMKEFERTMEAIAEHYLVLRFDKVEADDIAAHICNLLSKLKKRINPISKIWLISSDRDWDLMVNDDVSRWSYVTTKETTIGNWHNHYDCEPEDYISMKCLQGDAGDNIMGVDKIGPKRAAELIKKYGTAYDIAMALPIDSKYQYIKNLNQSKDLILLNYELMDLPTYCDDAIGAENVVILDKLLEEYLA